MEATEANADISKHNVFKKRKTKQTLKVKICVAFSVIFSPVHYFTFNQNIFEFFLSFLFQSKYIEGFFKALWPQRTIKGIHICERILTA